MATKLLAISQFWLPQRVIEQIEKILRSAYSLCISSLCKLIGKSFNEFPQSRYLWMNLSFYWFAFIFLHFANLRLHQLYQLASSKVNVCASIIPYSKFTVICWSNLALFVQILPNEFRLPTRLMVVLIFANSKFEGQINKYLSEITFHQLTARISHPCEHARLHLLSSNKRISFP